MLKIAMILIFTNEQTIPILGPYLITSYDQSSTTVFNLFPKFSLLDTRYCSFFGVPIFSITAP